MEICTYITHIEDSEIDNWMCIVHDRIPTLPMTISNQLGFFDDLQINVKNVLKKLEHYHEEVQESI